MRPHDGRAIPTFIRQALVGEPLTVAGDGSQTRSICYVDDTVAGILALARSDVAGPGQHRQPAGDVGARLAETIRDLAGSDSPIEFIDRAGRRPGGAPPRHLAGAERLGWRPAVPLEEGLRRTLDWFAAELGVEAAAGATGA